MNDLISKEDVKKLTKQMYLEIGPAKYDVHTISDWYILCGFKM